MSDTFGPGTGPPGERAGPGERGPDDDAPRGGSPRDPAAGADGVPGRGSTAMWAGALLLGGAATVVLVLSDDARLLRLGLVAALWAALAGAFAVARLRGQVSRAQERARDDQRIYQLEIEREIAAREQHEAEARAEAHRRAAEESGTQLQELQAEMQRLRTTLEQVVGGDVLFEHVALRAESTRVRSLDQAGGRVFGEGGLSSAFARAGRSAGIQREFHQQESHQQDFHRQGIQAPQAQQAFQASGYSGAGAAGNPAAHQPMSPPGRDAGRGGAGLRAPQPARDWSAPAGSGRDPVAETALITPADGTGHARPAAPAPDRQQPESQQPESQQPRAAAGPVRAEGTIEAELAPEDPGAHTAGTSVEDLLAAYGSSGDAQRPDLQRRRRRRA